MPLIEFEITELESDHPDANLFNKMHVFRSFGFNIHFGVVSESVIPVITKAPTVCTSTGVVTLFDCPWKLDMTAIHSRFKNSEHRLLSPIETPPARTDFEWDLPALLDAESVAHCKRCIACFETDPVLRIDLFEKACAIYEGVLLASEHPSLIDLVKRTRLEMRKIRLNQPHPAIKLFSDDARRMISHCIGGMALCYLLGKQSQIKFVTLASAAVHWAPSHDLELTCMLRMIPLIAASQTAWSRCCSTLIASPAAVRFFGTVCIESEIHMSENVLAPLMLLKGRRDLFTTELGLIRPDRRARAERFAESTSKYLIEQLALPAPFTAAAVEVVDGSLVERKCAACDAGIPAGKKNSRCSGCGLVYYCCKDCQVAHWKQHKSACKKR
jgi:hypothetical protein